MPAVRAKVVELVESCPHCRVGCDACEGCGGSGVGLRCARCNLLWGAAFVRLDGDLLVCSGWCAGAPAAVR